jgi:hypothetical protein
MRRGRNAKGGAVVKRRVILILLLLVAGAIVNVAVAWGAANAFGERWSMSSTWTGLELVEQGWPAPSLTMIPPESQYRTPIVLGMLELALYPIWPGFAINTVFYAAVLWLLFGASFALRKRRLIRRGLCPKCAYDMRGTPATVCPECGGLR